MSTFLQIYGCVFALLTAIILALLACGQLASRTDLDDDSWLDWAAAIYLLAFVSAFLSFIIWLGNSS